MKQFLIIFAFFFYNVNCSQFNAAFLVLFGSNYTDYQNFTVNSTFSSISDTKYFNGSKNSVLLIHGYQSSFKNQLGSTLVEAFLTRDEFNIIFAEWSVYADDADYAAVVGKINGIAEAFVQLLNKIKTSGYDLERIYPIGHSLGAHLAGRIGKLLKSQNDTFPRITGLDPAGPLFFPPSVISFFGLSFNIPGNMLAKGDAEFVDIIHTNAKGSGTMFSTGNLDFWPNGGVIQPLCTSCKSILLPINCTRCSHAASWRFYAESVRSSDPIFISKRCPNSTVLFTNAICRGPAMASMGFHANKTFQSGDYFLVTKEAAPFSN